MTQYNTKEIEKYGGIKILMFSGTVVASGNNRTSKTYPLLSVMQFKEATFFFNCTELLGTPGTFDVDIDTKDPSGEYYDEIASFAQLAAIGNSMQYVQYCLGSHISVRWTLVGFTSATFSVYGIFKIR